jgi:hypothetical protein
MKDIFYNKLELLPRTWFDLLQFKPTNIFTHTKKKRILKYVLT